MSSPTGPRPRAGAGSAVDVGTGDRGAPEGEGRARVGLRIIFLLDYFGYAWACDTRSPTSISNNGPVGEDMQKLTKRRIWRELLKYGGS